MKEEGPNVGETYYLRITSKDIQKASGHCGSEKGLSLGDIHVDVDITQAKITKKIADFCLTDEGYKGSIEYSREISSRRNVSLPRQRFHCG